MRRLAAGLLIVVGVLVATTTAVEAHALLRSSQPAGGALVHHGPSAVVLNFSQAPDLKISSVDVLGPNGKSMAAGELERLRGRPERLRLPIRPLDQGAVTVDWRIVSSVDGDTTTGSFAFGVRTPVAAATAKLEPDEAGRPLLDVVGRSLLYAGLVVLVGGSAIAGLVLRPSPAPGSLVGLLGCAWAATAAGLAAFTVAKLSPLDVGAMAVFRSSLGWAVV